MLWIDPYGEQFQSYLGYMVDQFWDNFPPFLHPPPSDLANFLDFQTAPSPALRMLKTWPLALGGMAGYQGAYLSQNTKLRLFLFFN